MRAIKGTVFLTLFIIIRPESTMHSAPFDAKIGQGLRSTRWKGLYFFSIILLQWCRV